MRAFQLISWAVIVALFALGIHFAHRGSPWMLTVAILLFTLATGRLGGQTHSNTVKFICISLAWASIGALLGLGIFFAAHGAPLLLVLAFAGFVVTVGRVGCATH